MKRTIAAIIILFLFVSPLYAYEIGGAKLPGTMKVGEEELILNGAGLRKKFFIKVYAGALYLKQKSADAMKIIAADEPMVIKMHFIYDGVSKEKLIDAWNEGFGNALNGNTAPLQKEIDMFNSFFKTEAKTNDVYDVVYHPEEGTTVFVKGQKMGTIEGFQFKKAVFAIWLGKVPADSGLKEGMLGD